MKQIRAIGPLVFVRAFRGASFVVKNEKKDSLTDNHTGANCDQRWHKSSVHMVGGKDEVDTITLKKTLMEHF